MTSPRYLEVSYRQGHPIAAYLYLPRQPLDAVARTHRVTPTLLVDYASDDRPLGIELLDPAHLELATLNGLLTTLGHHALDHTDLAPLKRAG